MEGNNFESSQEPSKESDLSFRKETPREGVSAYIFNHVAIAIDITGKNQKDLPEIFFGAFEDKPSNDSLKQPETKIEGVDMNYVAQCIKEVAKDSGIHEFWLYPFGDDEPENMERRERARLRLFSKYADITPAESGFGYVLHI